MKIEDFLKQREQDNICLVKYQEVEKDNHWWIPARRLALWQPGAHLVARCMSSFRDRSW